MIDLKFSEIIKQNAALGNALEGGYEIGVLSNIIVSQIKPILEYNLRTQGIPANCIIGDYDNILQDAVSMSKMNAVLIFWELANWVDGFQYRSNLLSDDQTEEYIARFKSEIDYVLSHLKDTPLIIINKFSTLAFNQFAIGEDNFDRICETLNAYLKTKSASNIVVVDTSKVISQLSVERAISFRDYYSSKALYTVDFLKHYTQFITPVISTINGKRKKAIIFDCDNTLWEGIIGEDGIDGIKMSASSPKGVVFEEVQFLAKKLAADGILVCLNSKNNPGDIDEVFSNHSDLSLTNDEVIVKKINWDKKVKNLADISEELNIGTDSFVFVDDSDFEINLVNQYQPEITTIQVPKEKYLYPALIRRHLNLFYSPDRTKEDKARVKMYQQQKEREEKKAAFENIDEYLASLDLQVDIFVDKIELVPRLAQLTQKTNQFNLTTRRYTESEMLSFTKSDNYLVFAFGVKDKYGDFGITGLSVVELKGTNAVIDTLLMSCRVLGRNIEQQFLDEIIKALATKGVDTVRAEYCRTQKNDQVSDFYDKLGFVLQKADGPRKEYTISVPAYQNHSLTYIAINHA
ncbi:MAG: HAD-IIIC family phosphatase [Chitinophagaceae bacterium]|nr:HAD-IIIC family phosphatase [Chitinophagaceae bacterium]